MKTPALITLVIFSLSLMAKTKITWWHAMGGKRSQTIRELASKFNSFQNDYELEVIYRGNYTETLNASIAAYRGKKQPHIVQVFEVGTMTMMKSGAIYPIYKLFSDNNISVNLDDYLKPVLSYYEDNQGRLFSMPFNSSTPIMYANLDILKTANIVNPAQTWEELYVHMDKIAKTGKCGLTVGWQSWVLLENFSAIHKIPFADKGNGFSGFASTLKINNELVASNIQQLKNKMSSGGFSYEGRRSDASRNAFIGKKCAYYMDSSSNLASIKKLAQFSWNANPMPYLKSFKPQNSIIGGATLWVYKGHSAKEYQGVAKFMKFLGQADIQAWWHKETGYLPISLGAYKGLKKNGYYIKEKNQEIAIKQLTRANPTEYSRGLRLGSFTQIRDVLNEQFEKIWAGTVTVSEGLEFAEKRSNALLKRYKRTQKRKNKK